MKISRSASIACPRLYWVRVYEQHAPWRCYVIALQSLAKATASPTQARLRNNLSQCQCLPNGCTVGKCSMVQQTDLPQGIKRACHGQHRQSLCCGRVAQLALGDPLGHTWPATARAPLRLPVQRRSSSRERRLATALSCSSSVIAATLSALVPTLRTSCSHRMSAPFRRPAGSQTAHSASMHVRGRPCQIDLP